MGEATVSEVPYMSMTDEQKMAYRKPELPTIDTGDYSYIECRSGGAPVNYTWDNGQLTAIPIINIGDADDEKPPIRQFETGATRNCSDHKINPAKCLSPLVIQRYAEYMAAQRLQKDGSRRADDNWQKGFPLDSFMESGQRHNLHWWTIHHGNACTSEDDGHAVDIEEACCALLFNVMGYLHQTLKAKQANI